MAVGFGYKEEEKTAGGGINSRHLQNACIYLWEFWFLFRDFFLPFVAVSLIGI